MSRLTLIRWAAWSPGIEREKQWRAWSRAPGPLAEDGAPELRFLPALQRRRCDQLSRMILEVAHRCCGESLVGEVSCVFASRHGAFSTTVSLLEDLATDAELSPTKFSHSVHNTPAGQFSIWAKNRRPSTSLAAGSETFGHGFLEALCMLHRTHGGPVLFVTGEERLPSSVASLSEEPRGAYALALLLGAQDVGCPLEFRLEKPREKPERRDRPDALEFLRWWLSGEETLSLACEAHTWTWTRHG